MERIKFQLKAVLVLLVFALANFVPMDTAEAAPVLPEGYQVETVTTGFNLATTFTYASPTEIFVAEKDGRIVRVVNGQIQATPVYQIANINDYWDRGFLGIAADPNFSSNGYLYLSYTYENNAADYQGPKTARIVRITYNPATGTAAPNSETVLVGSIGGTPAAPSCNDYPVGSDCIPSNSPSHSAGGLRFGPDGYLYATLGDGAAFTDVDPDAYDAQDLDTLTGKVLRINTNGTGTSTNPFYDGDVNSNRSKIFAYGIRNSYRFNFHPTSGELYAGEVGWYTSEEVNLVSEGANLGWPCREGFQAQDRYTCTAPNYVDPLYAYGHENNRSNSVTGGSFATSPSYGDFNGSYFFGDYNEDFIRRAEIVNGVMTVHEFGTGVGGPVDIQTGPDGHIYYLSIYTGELRRIVAESGNQDPTAEITVVVQPNTDAPALAQFSAENSSDPDQGDTLTYAWNFGDGTAGTGEVVSHTYATEGEYTVTLTVTDSAGATDQTSLPITVGDGTVTADPVHISTEHTPIPTFLGRTVTTTTTIRNTGPAEPMIIYWEVRDENGVRVHNAFEENVVIPTNTEAAESFDWLPPTPGDYRVDVGLFSNDWRESLGWTFGANTINVVDRVAEQTNLTWESTTGDTSGAVGEQLTLDVNIKNNGLAGDGIVYVEFYNPQGVRESYQLALESYDDNGSGTTSFTWSPQQEGEYTVALGLFTPDWLRAYEQFNHNIHTVNVSNGSSAPFALSFEGADANNTQVGVPVDVTLSIANSGIGGQGIVYVEFYNDNGSRESYQFSLESFSANQTKDVTFSFTPEEAGEYTVALGLFRPNWLLAYEPFNPNVTTVTVAN